MKTKEIKQVSSHLSKNLSKLSDLAKAISEFGDSEAQRKMTEATQDITTLFSNMVFNAEGVKKENNNTESYNTEGYCTESNFTDNTFDNIDFDTNSTVENTSILGFLREQAKNINEKFTYINIDDAYDIVSELYTSIVDYFS